MAIFGPGDALGRAAAWGVGLPQGGGDESGRYRAYFDGDAPTRGRIDERFSQVSDSLRDTRVIFVPSWLSDSALPSVALGGSLGYMAGISDGLAREGIVLEIASVETEAGVAANAAHLAALVGTDDRPLCFITHSKGGLDVLEYLRTSAPGERARVRCWLALLAPFAGSPVADLVAGTPGVKDAVGTALSALGGDVQSLYDLTTWSRAAYLGAHKAAITQIFSDVPTLCVAGYVDDPGPFYRPASWTWPAMTWMRAGAIPNDGLVPVRSSTAPCRRFVVLRDIDHTALVAPSIYSGLDQAATIKLLLYLALVPRDAN
ncbi:MAG: hypothetical protein AB7N54_19275 [Alphaproteobacteria bacterium]